jgi:hypothetical protein
MNRFERDFERELGPMAEVAKPLSAAELQTLSEYQRGERDCLNGVPHKEQTAAYNKGYAAQYAREQEHDRL